MKLHASLFVTCSHDPTIPKGHTGFPVCSKILHRFGRDFLNFVSIPARLLLMPSKSPPTHGKVPHLQCTSPPNFPCDNNADQQLESYVIHLSSNTRINKSIFQRPILCIAPPRSTPAQQLAHCVSFFST